MHGFFKRKIGEIHNGTGISTDNPSTRKKNRLQGPKTIRRTNCKIRRKRKKNLRYVQPGQLMLRKGNKHFLLDRIAEKSGKNFKDKCNLHYR